MSTPSPAAATAFEIALTPVASIDGAAWDDLFARAHDAHPHFSRHVLAAHGAAGLAPADLAAVTVARAGRLEALLPYRTARDLSGLGARVARPFLTPFVTATDPLLAAGGAAIDAEAADALVAGLARASGGGAWRWPLLRLDSPAGTAMRAAMGRAGWSLGPVATFARPVLARRASLDAFQAGHPNRSRLKDLRRRTKRLSETGLLRLDSATGGAALAAAVENFLALERAGWKGEAGTAMACRPPHAALARALFAEGAGPVTARADSLTLDGRPIAISLALVGSGTATLLKTAYDEGLRAQAPGLVLEAEIVRACHETRFADRLDSATLAGSALESLYPEREILAEVIAVPPGADRPSLERRIRLARFEQRAREAAKTALRRR
ncbi:GNAT family N-acetyltransferase [Methylobacterium symbioticum]|nr:GNAT family N-acetyltransferase [uncultured Methylobacterium sp.]